MKADKTSHEKEITQFELEGNSDLENAIIAATTCLIDFEPEQLESRIEEALAVVGGCSGADRVYLVFFSEDGESLEIALEWSAHQQRSHLRSLRGIALRRFSWLFEKISEGQPVLLLNLEDLPPEAIVEREILRSQSIEGMIFVPVFRNGIWIGFFGVETMHDNHALSAGLSVLKVIAPLVGILWEKQKTQSSFLRDEKRFRVLIEHSSDLICILDARGMVVFASPSVQRILGYDPEDLEGKSIFTFVHPEEKSLLEEFYFQRIRLPGALTSYPPFRFRHQDGSWIFLEATGNNLLQESTIRGVVLNARDVSNRKQIEDDLAFEQNLLRTLVNTIPESVFVQDREGRILMVNDTLLKQCGIDKPRSLIGKPADRVFPAHCGVRFYSPSQGTLDESCQFEGQEIIAGEGGIFLTHLIPFLDHQGEVAGLVGISRDITHSRIGEKTVQLSDQDRQVFQKNQTELVSVIDQNCFLVWVNQAWTRETGQSLIEIQGKKCWEIWNQAQIHCEHCPTPQAWLTGTIQERERVDSSGTRWLVRAYPVRTEEGSPGVVVETRLDITDRKQTEE